MSQALGLPGCTKLTYPHRSDGVVACDALKVLCFGFGGKLYGLLLCLQKKQRFILGESLHQGAKPASLPVEPQISSNPSGQVGLRLGGNSSLNLM